jgi:hypothetical protein
MRIGIVGPTWPDSFADNIIDALRAMGHQPVSVGSTCWFGNPYASRAVAMIKDALLTEPALSAKIGDAAAARAHEGHRYEKRLAVILEKLS